MSGSNVSDELKYGSATWIVLFGLALIGCLAYFLTDDINWTVAELMTLIASLTTFLGTIVGMFLGVQAGAAGRANAENVARRALAALPPDSARQVLDGH